MNAIGHTSPFLSLADTFPMKTPITVRVEAGLLAAARHGAAQENRTLTNFIETALRRRVEETVLDRSPSRRRSPQTAKNGPGNAA